MKTLSSLRHFRMAAAALLAGSLCATTSHAAVIAHEDFESYTAGTPLSGLSGGTGFTGAWTGASQATVQSMTLVDPNGLVSGGSQALRISGITGGAVNVDVPNAFSRTFAATTDTLYVSYQVRVESFGDADFLAVLNSNGATGNDANMLSTGVRNNAGNPIFSRVGASNAPGVSTNVPSGPGSTVPDETDFLIVAKYSKVDGSLTYNQTEVFVNPVKLYEQTPSAVAKSSQPNISELSLLTGRVLSAPAHDSTVWLDSFTVATTFHEAVGAKAAGLASFTAAADAHVQNSQISQTVEANTNFGLSETLQVKNSLGAGTGGALGGADRKTYIRFEAPDPAGFQGYTNADLVLTVATTPTLGNAEAGFEWTFALYGLRDDAAGQNWIEGNGGDDNDPLGEITWNNAPGNTPGSQDGSLVDFAQMFGGEELATFTILGRGTDGAQIVLDDPRILEFIQSDTDGLISFLLVRQTLEPGGANSVVHQFRSSEHDLGGGPTLHLYGAIVPEPSVAILGLMSLAGLGLRRRAA